MDSVPSPSDDCGLVTASPADPDAGISEIAERILAEHARILRLFGALYDLDGARIPAVSLVALAQVWSRLADLLVAHTKAEEVCLPLSMYGDGAHALAVKEAAAADHNDIREAVEQARLLEAGSARWWNVITAARTACAQHFTGEERTASGAASPATGTGPSPAGSPR